MIEREFDNFDEFADNYRQIHTDNLKMVGGDSELYSQLKVDDVYLILKKTPTGKLLDYGCGDGIIPALLSRKLGDWYYYGIDVSADSIKVAKNRNVKNAEWKEFDGTRIPYPDGFFDAIFIANVFHHIEHNLHQKIVAELFRVLKKGGSLFFFEHNPYNPVTRHIVNTCPFDKDAVLLKPSYSQKLFKEVKFSSVKLHYILFFPRHKLFKLFWPLEPLFAKIPLGGQYFVHSVK